MLGLRVSCVRVQPCARRRQVPAALDVQGAGQLVAWLLAARLGELLAPGVPADTSITMADLGAGTCAACLGAKLALHDHAGDEQPYRRFPIDVASSSARFRRAFRAMTRPHHGRPALLPDQSAQQYLESQRPGIAALAEELFGQLDRREESRVYVQRERIQQLC